MRKFFLFFVYLVMPWGLGCRNSTTVPAPPPAPTNECRVLSNGVFVYTGPDGKLGVSENSCDDAKRAYKENPTASYTEQADGTVLIHPFHTDSYCDKNDEGYFVFAGKDGMVGASKESCEDAYQTWRGNTAPSVLMAES